VSASQAPRSVQPCPACGQPVPRRPRPTPLRCEVCVAQPASAVWLPQSATPAVQRPSTEPLAPPAAARRQRLLRLQQEVATLRGRLTALREETARLAAVEVVRPFTPLERRRVAQLKLHAEGTRLELQRLRTAVAALLGTTF
jgi:hypothetical protein